jgi:hypothetical protein
MDKLKQLQRTEEELTKQSNRMLELNKSLIKRMNTNYNGQDSVKTLIGVNSILSFNSIIN